MVLMAHATKNEKGTMWDGQPGDQNGREVCTQEFVEYEWDYVFRPKDKNLAAKIANFAVIIAENDNIGYGNKADGVQNERYTMYLLAKAANWDFAAVTTPCMTDCSQMVASICLASGLKVDPYMYTMSERQTLGATGAFDTIPYKVGMDLLPGDIILTERKKHTAIIVSANNQQSRTPKWVGECYGLAKVPIYSKPDPKSARCSYPTLATGNLFDVCDESGNWYYIRIAGNHWGYIEKRYVLRKTVARIGKTTTSLYVRANAGATYAKLGVLQSGAKVEICDTTKASNGADWHYIKYGDGWGFCSAKYVK